MPKLCCEPGCKNVVEGGASRCPQHLLPKTTPKRRYDHHYYQGKQIYKTGWWKRLRAAQLACEPTCRMCARFGIVTPADTVDHIVEISDGGSKDDPKNLQSLCRACHNKKTGHELNKRRKKRELGQFKSMDDF